MIPVNPADPWIDLVLKVVTAAATTTVAIYVARISKRQWLTNREKLRLDLYDRRFKIYVAAMELHKALVLWEGNEQQQKLLDPFIQAFRESKFLFPAKSGIFAFMTEFSQHAFFISNFEKTREMLKGDPQVLNQQAMKRMESSNWILTSMEPLEKMLAPFLNFHDI